MNVGPGVTSRAFRELEILCCLFCAWWSYADVCASLRAHDRARMQIAIDREYCFYSMSFNLSNQIDLIQCDSSKF